MTVEAGKPQVFHLALTHFVAEGGHVVTEVPRQNQANVTDGKGTGKNT